MRLFESKSLSQGEGEEQVMGLFGYGKTSPWAFLEKVQEGSVKLFSFSFFLFVFFKKFFIVIQLQLCAFSPHPSTPPQLNPPLSPTSTLPLDLVHVSFKVVPVIPSPHCPLPAPPCPLLDCS